MATVEATDPDWPFDLKHIELNITVPDEYPLESLQIVVIGPKIAPELLCNHITNKIRTWFNEKMEEQTKNDSFQLMIRPFLMWLDRNLVDLFIEGLKKVRLDLQAKAAGISMVTHTKEKVIADSEITEESEKVDDVLVEKEEENKAEESTSVPESSLAESVDRLSLNSECSFSHNADIRFTSWHLSESVATLIADKLTLMKRCDRCSYLSEWFINCGRKHVVSCDQCHSKHEVNIHSNLVHHFCPTIALLNIQGCTPIDLVLLSSEFRVTCLQCNKETGIKSIAHGIPLKTWCQSCHSKLELQIDTVRVTSSKPAPAQSVPLMSNKPKAAKVVRDVRIREGEPLPETGTCKHYRKSFRWFRFPCCGKLYPCDVCHEEKESHEIKFANRIICGFCAKEQPYQSNRPCNSCGGRVVKSRSSHWEGGKGCRDVTTMSKSDNQKYVNLNKSVSNQKKKVDELKSKKKSKQ